MRSFLSTKMCALVVILTLFQAGSPKRAEADVIAILTFVAVAGVPAVLALGGGLWAIVTVAGPYMGRTWTVSYCTDKGAACHNFFWLGCCLCVPGGILSKCIVDPEKYKDKSPPSLHLGSVSPVRTSPSSFLGTVKELDDFYKTVKNMRDDESISLKDGTLISAQQAKEITKTLMQKYQETQHSKRAVLNIWEGDGEELVILDSGHVLPKKTARDLILQLNQTQKPSSFSVPSISMTRTDPSVQEEEEEEEEEEEDDIRMNNRPSQGTSVGKVTPLYSKRDTIDRESESD